MPLGSATKKIGEEVRFDTHWEVPTGKRVGTIVDYDICRSKYKVAVHDWTGRLMPSVIAWIFPAESLR